jgi:hypothetical protein
MNQTLHPGKLAATNFDLLSVAELLTLHVQIGEELRNRNVVRTSNNPTGDLAEYLFCRAFGWTQTPNSKSGYDACGADKRRYQIKGRRTHHRNTSRQLSAIRNLNESPFDVLAGVLFNPDFSVMRAALIPITLVKERAAYSPHTHSHKFILGDDVWNDPRVQDVTAHIAAAMP